MCGDSAVQWSEYEAHKRGVESEIRSRICSQLQKLVEIAYDSGESQCFIQGIERAHDFIRSSASGSAIQMTNDSEDRLF